MLPFHPLLSSRPAIMQLLTMAAVAAMVPIAIVAMTVSAVAAWAEVQRDTGAWRPVVSTTRHGTTSPSGSMIPATRSDAAAVRAAMNLLDVRLHADRWWRQRCGIRAECRSAQSQTPKAEQWYNTLHLSSWTLIGVLKGKRRERRQVPVNFRARGTPKRNAHF